MEGVMRNGLLATVFILLSCGQGQNTHTQDYLLIDNGISDPTLSDVYDLMQEKCMNCHASWADYKTDDAWVTSGLVTTNDFRGSNLIISLKNYGGNMPPDGVLTDLETALLENWIEP